MPTTVAVSTVSAPITSTTKKNSNNKDRSKFFHRCLYCGEISFHSHATNVIFFVLCLYLVSNETASNNNDRALLDVKIANQARAIGNLSAELNKYVLQVAPACNDLIHKPLIALNTKLMKEIGALKDMIAHRQTIVLEHHLRREAREGDLVVITKKGSDHLMKKGIVRSLGASFAEVELVDVQGEDGKNLKITVSKTTEMRRCFDTFQLEDVGEEERQEDTQEEAQHEEAEGEEEVNKDVSEEGDKKDIATV